MKPVNVLYLIRTWAFGGPQRIILTVLRHLDTTQFRVTCAAYDTRSASDDPFVEALRREGCNVARERIPWRSRLALRQTHNALARLVDDYDIDLIHTHDPQSNVLAGLARTRWPCACVASAYGWWRRWFPLRSHVYQWVERNYALPRFDRVITVSEDMRKRICTGRTSPDRIRIIPTGIDLDALSPKLPRHEVRRKLRLPDDACIVGTVSRLYPEKGHCYLLDAAKIVVESGRKLHLVIVGDGPMRPDLETQAKQLGIIDHVTFTGFYDDLPGALSAMDIFAQPSVLDEGLPTSILEAQAMALPVVASDRGGTSEALDPGETGLLVKPKRPADLAETLGRLLDDPDRRARMGSAARHLIETRFSLNQMLDHLYRTYREALEVYQRSS